MALTPNIGLHIYDDAELASAFATVREWRKQFQGNTVGYTSDFQIIDTEIGQIKADMLPKYTVSGDNESEITHALGVIDFTSYNDTTKYNTDFKIQNNGANIKTTYNSAEYGQVDVKYDTIEIEVYGDQVDDDYTAILVKPNYINLEAVDMEGNLTGLHMTPNSTTYQNGQEQNKDLIDAFEYVIRVTDFTVTGISGIIYDITISDYLKNIVENLRRPLVIPEAICQAMSFDQNRIIMQPMSKWPWSGNDTDNTAVVYQYIHTWAGYVMYFMFIHWTLKEGSVVDSWQLAGFNPGYLEQDAADSTYVKQSDFNVQGRYSIIEGSYILNAVEYNNETYRVRGITVSNAMLSSGAWASDNTYPEYPYKAQILVGDTGYTDYQDYTFEVVFDVTEAISGNFAPVCNTNYVNNYGMVVEIYAKTIPSSTITIPTIKEVL